MDILFTNFNTNIFQQDFLNSTMKIFLKLFCQNKQIESKYITKQNQ